jgi:hypothetical protein
MRTFGTDKAPRTFEYSQCFTHDIDNDGVGDTAIKSQFKKKCALLFSREDATPDEVLVVNHGMHLWPLIKDAATELPTGSEALPSAFQHCTSGPNAGGLERRPLATALNRATR